MAEKRWAAEQSRLPMTLCESCEFAENRFTDLIGISKLYLTGGGNNDLRRAVRNFASSLYMVAENPKEALRLDVNEEHEIRIMINAVNTAT